MATTLCRFLRKTIVNTCRVPAVYSHTLSQTAETKPVDKSENQKDTSISTPQGDQAPAEIDSVYRANAETLYEMLTAEETKDVFATGVIHMTPQYGQHENPYVIPSTKEKRLIACLCDEDSNTLEYMWLHKGEPQRCLCGIFFRLEEVDAFGDPK
ncbi:uncharacterized protein LOC134283841 [Saccostrea cucullata]|uniref:uncharacterized protein LOC134283841 n=1 Tax=Saccostrea cuccullata TaxID=36930 RepID=UPI002ED296FC